MLATIPWASSKSGKHAVSTAARLLRRANLGRGFSGGPFVSDDLFETFDTVPGEGGHAIFAYTIDMQAAIVRVHGDREFVQPVLILAKHSGDMGDGVDGGDRGQTQAA